MRKEKKIMLIAKWEKIDIKRLEQLEDETKQLLVFNHITDIWVIMTSKELCRAFMRNVEDGLFDVYELRYVGKEICTDDVDFQEELDNIDMLNGLSKEMKNDNDDLDDETLINKMYDDGIFNYGEK